MRPRYERINRRGMQKPKKQNEELEASRRKSRKTSFFFNFYVRGPFVWWGSFDDNAYASLAREKFSVTAWKRTAIFQLILLPVEIRAGDDANLAKVLI